MKLKMKSPGPGKNGAHETCRARNRRRNHVGVLTVVEKQLSLSLQSQTRETSKTPNTVRIRHSATPNKAGDYRTPIAHGWTMAPVGAAGEGSVGGVG